MGTQTSRAMRFGVLLVALSLGLSVLMLGTVDRAEAQVTCAQGTQSGVRCEIEGAPPTSGVNGLECAAGFDLVGDRCLRFELASGVTLTCSVGILVVDECIEDLGPPIAGSSSCPVSVMVFEDGTECYMLVDKVGGDICPAGFAAAADGLSCVRPVASVEQTVNEDPACPDSFAVSDDAGGLCASLIPASQTSPLCPPGARGEAGACYFIVPFEATCSFGVLAGDSCVIEGAPPVNAPGTCPVSATVLFEGGQCFTLVNQVGGVCPVGTVADPGGLCRQAVPFAPGALTCSVGFGLVDGRCVRFEAAAISGCPAGASLDSFDLCREPVADRITEFFCTDAAAVLDGTDCVITVQPIECTYDQAILGCDVNMQRCPDGFAADASLGGICASFAPASQLPDTCPEGSRGSAGGCFILVAKGPRTAVCSEGVLAGSNCVITGPAPTAGPSTCPVSATVIEDGADCFLLVDADPSLGCLSGSTPDPVDSSLCRVPVARAPGALTCPAGFGLVDGNCVRFVAPVFASAQCPVGSSEDVNGDCRKPVADAAGAFFCESAGDALNGTSCVSTAGFLPACQPGDACEGTGCPGGFVLNVATQVCTLTVPAVETSASCPAGTFGSAGDCYVVVPATGGNPTCSAGVLIDADCVVTGAPPTAGAATCPVSATVMEDGPDCFQLVGADLGVSGQPCPAGTTPDPAVFDMCRLPVAKVPAALSCALGFGLVDGTCIRFESPTFSAPVCPAGSSLDGDGLCRQPVAVLGGGGFYCEDPNAALQGANCLVTAPFSLTCTTAEALAGECGMAMTMCPIGFTVDDSLGGLCARFEPASQGSTGPITACPDGSLGDPGGCFILVAKGPVPPGECFEGVLDGSNCVVTGTPPVGGLCEASFALVDGACVRFLAPAFPAAQCPPGSFEDAAGDCLKPVADIAVDPPANVPLACPEGSLGAPGGCYILVAKGPSGPGVCVDGVLSGASCTIEGDPPVSGPSVCPVSATVIEEGSSCFTRVPTDQTTACQGLTATPDPGNLGVCREPVDLVPGPSSEPFCPVSATVFEEGAQCYTLVAGFLVDFCPAGATSFDPVFGGFCRRPVNRVPGAAQCASSFSLVSGRCVRFETPVFPAPQCPAGSTEDFLGNCRKPVAAVPAPYFCADPAASLNGTSCVFVAAPIAKCDPASGACGGERTVQICPVTGVEVAAGDPCQEVTTFEAAVCAAGQVMDAVQTTQCRKPVDRVPGAATCPAGTFLVDGACLSITEPGGLPDLDCLGADAAACNNVVESEQDDTPIEELVSLRETEIDYFGCAGGTAQYQVTDAAGAVVASGGLTETSAGVYEGNYEVPSAGSYMLEVEVDCPDGSTNEAATTLVFIDPSGFILDCAGDIVVGATVTLSRSDTATGTQVVVADGDATIMDPSVNVNNPTLSGSDGRYRWDVVAGFYQVTATFGAEAPVSSAVLEVPPARTDVDLTFSDLNCPASAPAPVVTGPIRGGAEFAAQQAAAEQAAALEQPAAETAVATPASPASPPLAVTGTESMARSVLALTSLGMGFTLLGASRARIQRRRID